MLDILVSSAQNATLKELHKLYQSARCRRLKRQLLVEGIHLGQTCLAEGWVPERVVLAQAAAANAEIASLCESLPTQIPRLHIADRLFAECFEIHPQVGILMQVALPTPMQPTRPACLVLLEGVQDPGNVGTIVRTAAAAGADAVYLDPDCADVWSPKAMRAGMGGHFVTSVFSHADLQGVAAGFVGKVMVTQLQDACSLYAADLTGPIALVFGNEGQGVGPSLASRADLRVKIPMPGGVESLNVATAAAVCLFERLRQAGLG